MTKESKDLSAKLAGSDLQQQVRDWKAAGKPAAPKPAPAPKSTVKQEVAAEVAADRLQIARDAVPSTPEEAARQVGLETKARRDLYNKTAEMMQAGHEQGGDTHYTSQGAEAERHGTGSRWNQDEAHGGLRGNQDYNTLLACMGVKNAAGHRIVEDVPAIRKEIEQGLIAVAEGRRFTPSAELGAIIRTVRK